MSLNWDVTEVKDHEEITAEGMPWVVTEVLIWYTMAVDLGEITEENHEEFFKRVSIWESIHGAGMVERNTETDEHEDRFVTLEDVERRIGLNTNVSNREREEWGERLASILFDRADLKVSRLKRSRKREEAAA